MDIVQVKYFYSFGGGLESGAKNPIKKTFRFGSPFPDFTNSFNTIEKMKKKTTHFGWMALLYINALAIIPIPEYETI